MRLETAQVNAVKRLLRGAGLGHRSRSLGSERAWEKLNAALTSYGELRTYVELHRVLRRCARDQRTALDTMLAAQQDAFAASSARLQTVPGVGPIVAATALAVLSDVRRFPDAKHAASYAGLVPAIPHSGDREAYGHITQRGSGELRAMRCEAAHHASRPTHPLNPYFAQLCARRGYKMATVAVAHRLARILFALLRDGTAFDVRRLNIEEGPFTRTTVRRDRLREAHS